MSLILTSADDPALISASGGGKARNLARMSSAGFRVPEWFCVSAEGFERFLAAGGLDPAPPKGADDLAAHAAAVEERFLALPLPEELTRAVAEQLEAAGLGDALVAVRSSGLDEDSREHSFAGQFSSFLFQKGPEAIARAIRRCWASGFSERALCYRRERGLDVTDIRVGVVVQRMVDAEVSGVAFSRNPTRPLDRDHLVIDAVWGLGEGLVSGALDADHFEVVRDGLEVARTLALKTHAMRRAPEGGLALAPVEASRRKAPALTDDQVREVARLAIALEEAMDGPQDCEWAYEEGTLYCLQTRPITSLPPEPFYDPLVSGRAPTLWDNSNIIESYSGVTSPLTFSFASAAYRQVYIQFCEVMGVPAEAIAEREAMFRNMLGLIRGRIYYNLVNWYRLCLMLPGTSANKGFMDTMMGVKQSLAPELAGLFDFVQHAPRYGLRKRLAMAAVTIARFVRIDAIVSGFLRHFDGVYREARAKDLGALSLVELAGYYQHLDEQILRRWHAPIINDYLCMIFFGLLKRLTEKWVAEGDEGASLQNDLLCGEGDLESTEPTKWLMRIAASVDRGDAKVRAWLLDTPPERLAQELFEGDAAPHLRSELEAFLEAYGFRCVNELKLEEPDLHDDPGFALSAIASYVRMKSYSIAAMEEREARIRAEAEAKVRERLGGPKRLAYLWVLRQARRAVKNRENLRFARTKIFGVCRHLFRAVGHKLAQLGVIAAERDVFYLTVEELLAFVEGRPTTEDLGALVRTRRRELDRYRRTPPPPDRLLTYGAVGASIRYEQVLADGDLLRDEAQSDDPDVLRGTPCCPGTVEGAVLVATTPQDAARLRGEILVTSRTDPGWVPLYPSSSGLLIERGSLLSHSAVVARELGLPTIVGVSGGLMQRLKTGDRVRVDAGRGEIRILRPEAAEQAPVAAGGEEADDDAAA